MDKRFRFAALLWTFTLAAACLAAGGKKLPMGYTQVKVGKHAFHVVVADLRSDRFTPKMVLSSGVVPVGQLVRRSTPVAAITGTFFGLNTRRPVAEVMVDGDLKSPGRRGTVLAVDWYGQVKIFDVGHARSVDWSKYRYGLRGAVRVVSKGKVRPNPRAQRFKDKRIWGRASRTGVGITKSGKLCLIATSSAVTLSELGKAMRKVGVVEGVSLDGGSSTCLYMNGAFMITPKRKLNNLFVLCRA